MEGRVILNGRPAEKQGELVPPGSKPEIMPKMPFVSRGGLKLEGVFADLGLDASGKSAADIGASTGGFTDFLLQNGASRVTSIDVGYGLLDWKLRNLSNVDIFEKTNIRYFDVEKMPYRSDITVTDVSFISIKKIMEKILKLTRPGGEILLLFKPQFELRKEDIKNRGIVKDPALHCKSLKDITGFLTGLPVSIQNITYSKIKGARGNIEFWIYLINYKTLTESDLKYDKIIKGVVNAAHLFFKKEQ